MMLRDPVTAYVGLGASLGDAVATVRQALHDLGRIAQTRLVAASDLYRSAPYETQGPDFINAVAALSTSLTAPDLLAALQQLELAAGRERPWRYAPRTLDLDLLLYGSARVSSPALIVPHPRFSERAFVLVPLAAIAPDQVRTDELAAVSGQHLVRLND